MMHRAYDAPALWIRIVKIPQRPLQPKQPWRKILLTFPPATAACFENLGLPTAEFMVYKRHGITLEDICWVAEKLGAKDAAASFDIVDISRKGGV